jgi:hypothetical protein
MSIPMIGLFGVLVALVIVIVIHLGRGVWRWEKERVRDREWILKNHQLLDKPSDPPGSAVPFTPHITKINLLPTDANPPGFERVMDYRPLNLRSWEEKTGES